MKRSWVPALICLVLLSTSAVLHAEPAAPASPAAAPAAGCGPQAGALSALQMTPISQQETPAVLPDPLSGATPQAWVCCTAEDRTICQAECSPCSAFPHCFAFECVCDCFC